MFDYPLPIPRNTLYSEIGVGPEATTEEIRDATEELKIAVDGQKKTVDAQIEELYEVVPGLRGAYQEIERLQAQTDSAGAEQLRTAQKKLVELEQKAERHNPNFRQLRDRLSEIGLKFNEINQMKVRKPETRVSYDRANPPLDLFKLAKCMRDELADNKIALALLRRELSEFFAARHEEVFHPSDLTREDFSSDFAFNSLLDGPQP